MPPSRAAAITSASYRSYSGQPDPRLGKGTIDLDDDDYRPR